MRPSSDAQVSSENYLVVCEVVAMGVNARYQKTSKLQNNLVFSWGDGVIKQLVVRREGGRGDRWNL
jgi:hypothetical protein